MFKNVARRAREERGASLVEYALLVALIAVVCITAVTIMGKSASGKLDGAGKAIDGAGPCTEAQGMFDDYYFSVDGGHNWSPGHCP